MARRNEAGQYLLEGLTPQQIERRMGIGLSSVRQYLCTLVGEGVLRHSDIAFNVAEETFDRRRNS
jgi:DNA-binding IclR family transcriptional regulator